jgi:tRNA-binding EMAP/Myf-like protein
MIKKLFLLPLKRKIRGQESHGMICAEDELGLGQSHDGIMVLTIQSREQLLQMFSKLKMTKYSKLD